MLKKSKENELWFYVKDSEKVGILARVPELLRLNLISIGPDFDIEDLNKWLYLTMSGDITEYSSLAEAKADLD